MTAKKAIGFSRMHFEYLKERWKPYPDYNVLEAIRFAISAIEKQIPKKPIFANNMMTKDKFLMCPCCEFRFPDSLVFLKIRCCNCFHKFDLIYEE